MNFITLDNEYSKNKYGEAKKNITPIKSKLSFSTPNFF